MSRAPARLQAEPVIETQDEIGESPLWDDRRQRLVWVDITGGRIHELDPVVGAHQTSDVGVHVGAAALRADEGLALAVRDGFATWRDGELTPLATIEEPAPGAVRMNDAKVDPAGRFWGGTLAYDLTPGAAVLYRLDPDGTLRRMLDGLTCSNGMDWTDDGRTMLYVDSLAGGVDRFDFDAATGAISNRARVVEIPESEGLPDGLTLDADGCFWVAVYGSGEVRRYTLDGELLAVVSVPTPNVTSCAFGGADLADLYVTSAGGGPQQPALAGSLFRCRPGATGRLANRFPA